MGQCKPLVLFRNPGPGSLGRGPLRTPVSGEAQRHVGCLGLGWGGNAGFGRRVAPLHPDPPWSPLGPWSQGRALAVGEGKSRR